MKVGVMHSAACFKIFIRKPSFKGWVCISIVRVFAYHAQTPEFNPQHFINPGMVMQQQVEAEERKVQGHP